MSLPTSQLRTLDAIERRLHALEPRLSSMFAIFTRLTQDETLPHRETIDQPRRSPGAWIGHHVRQLRYMRQARRARHSGQHQLASIIAVAIVPFMLVVAISTVVALAVQR